MLVRAQEMAHYVEDGILDAGLTGRDWILDLRSEKLVAGLFPSFPKAPLLAPLLGLPRCPPLGARFFATVGFAMSPPLAAVNQALRKPANVCRRHQA
jgi:hypothetical protein